jgi:hypothetical protein
LALILLDIVSPNGLETALPTGQNREIGAGSLRAVPECLQLKLRSAFPGRSCLCAYFYLLAISAFVPPDSQSRKAGAWPRPSFASFSVGIAATF